MNNMKAKLIKTEEGFSLCIPHEGTNEFIASTDGMYVEYTLSLKNCEAIERGYDLEELAINHANEELSKEFTSKVGNFYGFSSSYIEGFKKALELLGDKVYTVPQAIDICTRQYLEGFFDAKKSADERSTTVKLPTEYLRTLEAHRWDVEIVEECLDKDCDGVNRKGSCISSGKPKLDENGCIILRRI